MAELIKNFMDAPGYLDYSPIFPNPFICGRDLLISGVTEAVDRLPLNGTGQWLQEMRDWMLITADCLSWNMVILPLLVAVIFTIIRVVLNHALLYRIPKWYKLDKESSQKFPESIFKFLVYSVTWTWAVYLVVFGKNNFFYDLESHWQTWYPHVVPSASLYWLYMIEMGFYLHSAYATVYIETIRKDFVVLMLHHIVTLALLFFSFILRFHNIGLLILFVHDIGDVCLELSKTVLYFKNRGGKDHFWPEMIANICFGVFTLQHILFRIYWFPTKAMYSVAHVGPIVYPRGPYLMFFAPLLWALYAMQIYWFKLILILLWKILIKGEKIVDTREYEDDEAEKMQQLTNDKTVHPLSQDNGVRKRGGKTDN